LAPTEVHAAVIKSLIIEEPDVAAVLAVFYEAVSEADVGVAFI